MKFMGMYVEWPNSSDTLFAVLSLGGADGRCRHLQQRLSGDAVPLSMAAERLQQFLAAVEVVAIEPPSAD